MSPEPGWITTPCESGGCVQVKRPGPGILLMRTSDAPRRDIALTDAEWAAFVAAIKNGVFNEI